MCHESNANRLFPRRVHHLRLYIIVIIIVVVVDINSHGAPWACARFSVSLSVNRSVGLRPTYRTHLLNRQMQKTPIGRSQAEAGTSHRRLLPTARVDTAPQYGRKSLDHVRSKVHVTLQSPSDQFRATSRAACGRSVNRMQPLEVCRLQSLGFHGYLRVRAVWPSALCAYQIV